MNLPLSLSPQLWPLEVGLQSLLETGGQTQRAQTEAGSGHTGLGHLLTWEVLRQMGQITVWVHNHVCCVLTGY